LENEEQKLHMVSPDQEFHIVVELGDQVANEKVLRPEVVFHINLLSQLILPHKFQNMLKCE